MLAQLLLACTLLVASTLGAPANCGEFCDDQAVTSSGYGSAGGSRSYSSYGSKSSYDHRMQRVSNGASNLGSGSTYGRLENLDENVISGSNSGVGLNLDRPGNWQDEKHYVTDDGRGQMSYRAGQTVTGNGFSKFAEHSYSYGSHDSHAPLSNSQVLSTAEFNQELQSMRQRIAAFMGSFHVGTGSVVNANLLADFKNKASVISNQLTDVCNQVDIGSSMHQQMQQMQQQFQKDVEKLQHQMEQQMVFQSTSSSSSSVVHGSSLHQYPSYVPSTPSAPLQTYPSRPTYRPRPSEAITEENLVQQRIVEEELTKVQQQVSTFYTSFNRADIDIQYQTNLNTQADQINQKLASLKLQAIQNESARARIEQLKSQFESYTTQIRSRIQEVEDRRRQEEVKRIEAELEEEHQRHEENRRIIEQKKLKIKQEEEENKRLREEAERQKLQEEEAQRIREEAERQRQEEDRRHREELARLELIHQQEEEARKQSEKLQLQQLQQQVEQVKTQHVQQQQPQMSSTLEVTGHASYDHSIKTYGGQHQQQSGSYVSHARPQPVMNAHVDLTALTSRLQQELNRLQNEINNFNTYTMRLTAANSQSVINEAEHQAESLRQSINNLCETSGRYENQNIHSSAEELSRRFEEMFRSLQSQAANYSASGGSGSFSASAGYSSHSSYGSSGAVSSVRAPTITNVEYEHSKSAEVEISRRPMSSSSQRYSSGQQQVECVEVYAGQPCVEPQQQPRRYRRSVGGK